MIVDIVYVSSDDDEVVVTEEPNVHGKGVHVKAEFFDLTSDNDIFEEGHIAYEQGGSAQGASFLKQEFTVDDGHEEAAQCTVTLQMQNLGAGGGQGDASQFTETLQVQKLRADDGQSDAVHSTGTLLMQELKTDGGQRGAAQCTASLHMQELRADDVQGDAAQCVTTLQMQELSADDGQGDAVQCITLQKRQEPRATLQTQKHDGQGDAAWFTPTLQRQEHTADNEQGDTVQCTTTQQRQESIADDTQGDFPHCTTALQWQGSHKAQCTTTLLRQEFLAAGGSMQEAALLRNSAEATTSLTSTQGRHMITGLFNVSTATPFPRQFWKAGDYGSASQAALNNGHNRLQIHPKFLHSNATSHKWPFGAIAELLDNAIDEVSNGATFVKIDKMKHSPDGDYSLVIEDNGGGMSPKSLRHCMSFGFSQKCTTSSIGQYGNGFKTSTMRLGADAIVFTCTKDDRRLTRSIGLLSYTFLMRSNCSDIFVPAVDYELDASSSTFKRKMNCGEKHFLSNLSTLLKWCSFSTEDELLNQFSDMECHGTKIFVFNLWLNDALEMELDFITDKEDILISGAPEIRPGWNTVESLTQMHVANRFRYSLRPSMLYLHVPENFQIILCGRAVEPHYVVNDLIYRECIKYRPQVEVTTEVDAITTIGFLKGAPRLDIYGFSVYHKNRLILPYWCAGSCSGRRRGIAGVLEANFIRPTHDKQDFERTGLFQRLETRLKDMAKEYWTYHCHMVGYNPVMKRPPPAHYVSTTAENSDDNLAAQSTTKTNGYNSRAMVSVGLHPCSNGYNAQDPMHADVGTSFDQMRYDACPSMTINVGTTLHSLRYAPQQSQAELYKQRKSSSEIHWRSQKRRNTNVYFDKPESDNGTEMAEFRVVLDSNTMLKAECSELEEAGKQLASKADKLRKELDVWRRMYQGLSGELRFDGLEGLRRSRHCSSSSIGFI
ncbi:protein MICRORCHIDIA 6-like [Miscanthus floridulus]|uniref:protein MICRORCHIDIA 6-like n=1 Tax=Miscanthus floridulus TaxID=154761 RepID=UPI003457436A